MTRLDPAQLERALRETSVPGEPAARERVRATVLAAHAQRPRRRRAPWRAGLAAFVVVVLAVVAQPAVADWIGDSPPGRAVSRIVNDIVKRTPATVVRPPIDRASGLALPAAGRLLVAGENGLWLVERDGTRHRLGAWSQATWSPGGLFIAVAAGRTLAAVDPGGAVHWRLDALGGPVSDPRWAPDGTHIAYLAGDHLRIVYGNGLHDVPAGAHAAAVAPAWQPNAMHTVAWASTDGTVTVEDADTGKLLWRHRGGPVRTLSWSAGGRLLVAGLRHAAVYDLSTGARTRVPLPAGGELTDAAFAPAGSRLALAVRDPRTGVTALRVEPRGATVLAAPGTLRDLRWSPDGHWLLAGRPGAGQWLLVRARGGPGSAIGGIPRRFGAAARTQGWCCS